MAIARTALGDLSGTEEDGVAVFRGVPYAAAPVGELRFAPPQAVPAWSGQRDASQHGPIAPQMPSRLRAAMGDFDRPQNEDCLTLTIWSPGTEHGSRPVLVWLHGGAWISGAGSLDWYDGARLAREGDIVVVGVNYRLGALGFLCLPGVADGTLGWLDQVAALRWVRAHIAGFGGDPERVTVMGQSAGAASIGLMLADEAASGLFQRAILQSGGFGRAALTPAQASVTGEAFVRALALDPDDGGLSARLRDVPVAEILAAQVQVGRAKARFGETMPPFPPVAVRPANPAEGAAGKQALIGATREECHAFFAADPAMAAPDPAVIAERFAALTGSADALARYQARRPGGSLMEWLADVTSDHTFLWPAMRLAGAMAAQGAAVQAYQFDWAPPASRFKACHCIELPFVFGNLDAWPGAGMLDGGDRHEMEGLSARVRRAWIDFVRDGSAGEDWPGYRQDERWTMRLGRITEPALDPAGLRWRARE